MGISIDLKRSLVVDDDDDFRRSLIRRLKRMGYQSSEAESSEEAIQKLEKATFDVIFLDLNLPGVHGAVLLRELDRQNFSTPIVVMSGAGEMEDVIDAFRCHAVDYLNKPFGADALTSALDRSTEKRDKNSTGPGSSDSPPPPRATPEVKSPPPAPEVSAQEKPSRSTSIRASVARVVAAVRSNRVELPILDPLIGQIQELIQRPDVSAKEVVQVIERDPALVVAVLRSSNRAYYRLSRRVLNLEEACMRLGNKQVFSIVLEIQAQKALVLPQGPYSSILERMWRNSYASARLARRLAEKGGMRDSSEPYLVTLLHNVGELLLLRILSELGEDAPELETLATECARLHERFGETLTSSWKLNPSIIRVAGHHHEPAPSESQEQQRLRHLVLASWTLAIKAGYTYFPGQEFLDPQPHLEILGFKNVDVAELCQEAQQWDAD